MVGVPYQTLVNQRSQGRYPSIEVLAKMAKELGYSIDWLFSDTPKGADSSAVIYSLVESAKANDLEPRSYLWFLLDEMRYLDKSPSAAELDTRMPWSPGIRKLLEKEYS